MKWLNTNSVHNFLNIAITVVAAWGLFDWSTLGFNFVTPQRALAINAVLGLMKLTMNAVRDGLKGMVESQPPVSEKK